MVPIAGEEGAPRKHSQMSGRALFGATEWYNPVYAAHHIVDDEPSQDLLIE